MNIGFLSSGKISIPLIQTLAHNRLLAWVAVPNKENESVTELLHFLQLANIEHFKIEKEDFEQNLLDKIRITKTNTIFVLGFPWKIGKTLLDIQGLKFWNFHFGTLPQYRGNAPIFWQIKQQEKFAAVTIHLMNEDFDAGAIAHVEKIPILPNDTYGILEKKLSHSAVNAAFTFVNQLMQNSLQLTPQNHQLAKTYKKPFQKDVFIDWNEQTAQEIQALVNATNPWNRGAYSVINQQYVRFLQVNILHNKDKIKAQAGAIVKADKEGLRMMTKDGFLLDIAILYLDDGFFTGAQFAQN